MKTIEQCVPGFLPSIWGLRFTNHFPPGPVLVLPLRGARRLAIGDASNGLCGGMVFTVRDYFEAGQRPPDDDEPPGWGSPLFHYLVRRLFDSFRLPSGPVKYYTWMTLPEHDTWYARGLLHRTFREEWPRLRAEIDRGRLAALGFIRHRSANPFRLGENHQVMAYGYTRSATGEVALRIYDPNHGPCDDLTMTFDPSAAAGPGSICYSTGECVRGFFHTPFRRPFFGGCLPPERHP
jgi:hypothetical protein